MSDEQESKRARTTPPGEASASGAAAGGSARASPGFDLAQSSEYPLLSQATPFPNESGTLGFTAFTPGAAAMAGLDKPVLVVGAGGLGCEVLKDLALSGVRNIHVVDMDTIDLTNLNRQFLFRMKDVGAPKAATAAAFVASRVAGCVVTPWQCRVQDLERAEHLGEGAFARFGAVVGCLDNLEARRWVNAKLCSLAQVDEGGALTALPVPYVDGGSEAMRGHVKVVLPKFTACLECVIENFTPPTVIQMCTMVSKPRKPEHCVAYIMDVEWPKAFPQPYDTDSPEDMHWINSAAMARAEHFGIPGVNYTFTLGVVKKIIPAIAATNALVSAGAFPKPLPLPPLPLPALTSRAPLQPLLLLLLLHPPPTPLSRLRWGGHQAAHWLQPDSGE